MRSNTKRNLVRTTVLLYEDQVMYAKRTPIGLSEFIRQSIDNEIESSSVLSEAKVAALDVLSRKTDLCTPEKLYEVAIKQGIFISYAQVKKYLEGKRKQYL